MNTFSWREFVNSNNGELVGAYGNLVNRTLVFIQKYLNNKLPCGNKDEQMVSWILKLYIECGEKIEKGEFKAALEEIFEFIRSVNRYYDKQKPWITVKEDIENCNNTIYNCTVVIANLSNLLEPFLPFSSLKIRQWLGVENSVWGYTKVEAGQLLGHVEILFNRIDKKNIDEELSKLGKA